MLKACLELLLFLSWTVIFLSVIQKVILKAKLSEHVLSAEEKRRDEKRERSVTVLEVLFIGRGTTTSYTLMGLHHTH